MSKKSILTAVFRLLLLITHHALLITIFIGCSSSRHEVRQFQEKGTGVASWYGSDFHGRPTASGEKFDMHANTCAHKEYPFGTKVKVTNTLNSRSVECTVNDRGPFVEGRDIDLSYASAKVIGLTATGTARVLIEAQGRDTSYIKTVRVQSSDRKTGPFAIQVGSFSENVNAVRLKVGLRLKYANAYIQEAEVKGSAFYRVRVGNFDSFKGAMETAEKLGQEGYPVLIVKADVRI